MLKITEIAFGLEERWRHRHRDAVCVPHHVSLIALIFGILAGDVSGWALEAGRIGLVQVVFWGALAMLCGVLIWLRRRACATFRMTAVGA